MPSSVPHPPTFAYLLYVKASFKADVKYKGFETIYGTRGVLRFPPRKNFSPNLDRLPPALAAHPPNSKLVSQISVFCSRTGRQDWGFHAFPVAPRFLCSCAHQREARRPETPAERLREAANGHDRTHCKIVALWRAAGVVSRVVQRPTRFANPENIAHHLVARCLFWGFSRFGSIHKLLRRAAQWFCGCLAFGF